MEISVDSLDFSQPLRGAGPRQASKTLVFARPVRTAVAGLSGWLAEYGSTDDHHVGRLDLRLTTEIVADTVTVTGTFGVRDWSGDWDDPYDGILDFVVIAELESVSATPPRPDLAITGIEFSQATQFFRADRYLDPGNVRPDNSVFLIDGKSTGVRVYVDWDSSAGLTPIAQLTGQLVVTNAAVSTTLTPINPGGSITPRRDATISQANPNHTLNFMIPSGLSSGEVTVTCQVFDQAAPGSQSAAFTRTLIFTPIEPLNVFTVGVTTQQPPAPAPTQAAIVAAFPLLTKTYPRSSVQFTGYNTITLAPPIVGLTASSGCGPGWSSLLDQLSDLRGGSGDVYFGGLPPGIWAAGVIGCSPVGDRVAASFIDLVGTIPHEVGHSLGLRHDPCRGCAQAAQDPDPDYPQYDTFNSDSIGVFGYDPSTNTVFNPASALDFMTAFLPATPWISPYRHQQLLGSTLGGPSPSGAMTLLRGERMTLFLGLEIGRDRMVDRRVSFHHLAPAQGSSGCEAPFTYELLDADRRLLDCGRLHCRCSGVDCDCWPKVTRDAVPYPDGTAYLRIFEGDTQIYEEAIPAPPDIKITGQTTKEGVRLRWQSEAGLAYLIHYEDKRSGQWRGAAPRMTATSYMVPRRLFGDARVLRIRVLASSGIATAVAETEIRIDDQPPPDVSIRLPGGGPTDEGPTTVSPVTRLLATDASGGQVPEDRIRWYDAGGSSIGRGSEIDFRRLPPGQSMVRAVVRGNGGRTTAKSWLIDRDGERFVVRAVICDPEREPSAAPHEHPHPAPKKCDE